MAAPAMQWKPQNPNPRISTRGGSVNCKRSQLPMMGKKKGSKPGLIRISTADGKWHGNWKCEYVYSLEELQLQDLPEDAEKKKKKSDDVHIVLCIQKHAGFGLSVEGNIATCFTRKCCNCCTPFARQINTTFKVWILPSTRQIRDYSPQQYQLPDLGCDDPSVIHVKPGFEADLDSLIRDSVRLATSVEETCSESCEMSELKFHHLGAINVASIDQRWSKLLELKKNTI